MIKPTDYVCKKCGMKRYSFPSCGYVERVPGSKGQLEVIQCCFIDWLLLSKLAQISPSGELTTDQELDIIPDGCKEAVSELLAKDLDLIEFKLEFEKIVERYQNYIRQLTTELNDTIIKPRRAARLLKLQEQRAK